MVEIPKIEQRGSVRQLILDGKPFLILGGELGNSTASHLPDLDRAYEKLAAMNLNTVLVPVCWDLFEPEEGKFDFTLVEGAILGARKHGLRLVLLWFGTWKNSMSCYAPSWVKRDSERFARVLTTDGTPQEIISPSSREVLEADKRAYLALMTWLAEFDGKTQTVLMMQIENEIGMIPEARDHSTASAALWDAPTSEMGDLGRQLEQLKLSDDGRDVRETPEAEEVFTAWQFATFVEEIAAAGKEIYPLPTFVNAALIRPGFKPGQYPSGGPLPHLLEVWQQFAPSLDFLAPDIYFPNFVDWAERYNRSGNAVFIPEMAPSARMSANALHAIAALGSMGTCPFAIEDLKDEKAEDLGQLYCALKNMFPLVVEGWAKGTIVGMTPRLDFDWNLQAEAESVELGGIVFTAKFDRAAVGGDNSITALPTHGNGRWEAPLGTPLGGVMILQLGDEEFVALGKGTVLTFAPAEGEHRIGIESCQAGSYADGLLVGARWLNGDQTHQGRHIHLYDGAWTTQRFRLYRY
jgi:hypothetical protein